MTDENGTNQETFTAPPESAGVRLDTWLGRRQEVHSRTFFQQLIKDGRVLVNGEPAKRSMTLEGGEEVTIDFPPAEDPWPHPQDIPIDVLHEDDDIIVVNKASGMVVHPAAGNPDGTLVNALLHRFPDLPGINGVKRPGLVHRLDRETSGVLVIAKNDQAMKILSGQIRERIMKRRYLALVIGEPDWDVHTVEAAIGRHEHYRIKRSVDGAGAKNAITHLHLLGRLRGFSLLECRLDTGRTHQIRVHCTHIGLPIVGDELYGGTQHRALEKVRNEESEIRTAFLRFGRPFLHARLLRFRHPADGRWVEFCAPIPDDMKTLLEVLVPRIDVERLMPETGDEDGS
ncbi:RluA family pseudouridine synthase [bacterium]|nr:RluA family pseudouridine synthase [bacterium]